MRAARCDLRWGRAIFARQRHAACGIACGARQGGGNRVGSAPTRLGLPHVFARIFFVEMLMVSSNCLRGELPNPVCPV
eukprot:3883410-Prymnesium_polylepis.1